MDIGASSGSAIVAAASGRVTTSAYSSSAGNYVVISHGNGISTVYMHASARYVSEGDVVSKGQTIAAVGSTGFSTGPHLHFGVIVNGSYVNPLGYVN
ncbi:MAG: M23 family metallopeptidase [Clostridia bacterium]